MLWPATKSEPALAVSSTPVMARSRFPVWLMAVMLALVTIVLYWPVTRCDFINYDDQEYVTANLHVQGGLNWEGVKWAFLNPVSCNWHPLTMLSHMMDCQFFGLNPRGHHLTNVLLHALNVVLVFALFQQLTGATWRSLFVAALFAVHPLRVESVAWVAERKDVLSGCFGLLSLIFYACYVRERPQRADRGSPAPGSTLDVGRWTLDVRSYSAPSYFLALFFFACGLMSKPMLVTWPFVMLLLDYWPLHRFQSLPPVPCPPSPVPSVQSVPSVAKNPCLIHREADLRLESVAKSPLASLLFEKIPFFALAVVASVVTLLVQKHGGALAAGENLPLGARSANALVSCCRYSGKLFWPADLAVFYPHPRHWPIEQVLLAAVLLLGISFLLIVKRQRYPFLMMGWLWFCGTLVPVIGLVQVGGQAMADRYTYIPSLGVLVLAIWGAYELARRWRYYVIALSVAGSAVIVVCMTLARQQLGHWKDSETLGRHALEVTKNNYLAHLSLGVFLFNKGQMDEAIRQYRETIRLNPDYAEAHYNLGAALGVKGQMNEAIRQYQEAIGLKPDYTEAHNNLGAALGMKGQIDEAIRQLQKAIRLKPDYAEAYNNLGIALGKKGQMDEAIRQYRETIRLNPDYADAHYNLGTALGVKGQIDEAIRQFQEAIRLNPDYAEAHNNLGINLGMKGQIDEAISQLQKAIRLNPDYAEAHNNLGTALGKKGQMDEAIRQYQEAIRLNPDYADARNNLQNALLKKGQTDGGIR